MSKKMLIDATHKEETRVAIVDGNKLVEYDYESQYRKPLKGSIFLAKVTRVEPSLQAAFVNFGGNRHGFLPFSEIHPDYFKIPVSDREALMAEQEALLQEHDEEEAFEDDDSDEEETETDEIEEPTEPDEVGGGLDADEDAEASEEASEEAEKPKGKGKKGTKAAKSKQEEKKSEAPEENEEASEEASEGEAKETSEEEQDEKSDKKGNRRGRRGRGRGRGKRAQYRNKSVEIVGGEEIDEQQRFRFNLRRKYKIQEVIKRGQIMLVQVNKEERGNKGAAVGSYLSLPGRYCVLMPNSPRAGGVSRKIANHKDRARMRDIVKSLEVPKGMSVIVRTAGVTRSKAEIKRDLDYLMRLWNNIRELTLESTAPTLVYEEADLIKRAVRDLYTSDVEEVLVAGQDGYKTSRDFMKMMIPSHVKKIKQYEGGHLPLFNRYQIESQINEIGQPEVRLASGGYLVINPTEALVSVDVNSGKATKGRHIEETALKTNLEAADEVARQLKLRDLGGLVVIDFIDMENRSNNGKVERRMKEALSSDRARVQVGRISSFGLMELSRQRLSPSLTEAQFEKCNNCNGIGLVRTDDAMSIIVLRAIEEEGIRGRAAQLIVQVPNSVALYILNFKRNKLAQIEERYNIEVLIRVDDSISASDFRVEVSKPAVGHSQDEDDEDNEQPQEEDDKSSGRGRRRGRRGGRGRNNRNNNDGDNQREDSEVAESQDEESSEKSDKPEKGKKRGGRRKKSEDKAETADEGDSVEIANDDADSEKKEEKPKKKAVRKTSAAKKQESGKKDDKKSEAKEEKPSQDKEDKKEEPKKAAPSQDPSEYETVNQAPKSKKRGWWNR